MRLPVTTVAALLLFSAALTAADLSTYRGFRLGMTLTSAVKHSGMDLSEVTTLQQRPAKIEQLDWNPERFSREAGEKDPVRKIVFSFYNGQLSRMAVEYDAQKTEGMSAQDLIGATAIQYGPATSSRVEESFPSAAYSEGVAVAARWEDTDYSLNLVQAPNGSNFGLIALSKKLDGLAQASIASGRLLDEQEAPQRVKDLGKTTLDRLDRARTSNRANFRP